MQLVAAHPERRQVDPRTNLVGEDTVKVGLVKTTVNGTRVYRGKWGRGRQERVISVIVVAAAAVARAVNAHRCEGERE